MRAALALAACFLVLLVGGGARLTIGLTFKPAAIRRHSSRCLCPRS